MDDSWDVASFGREATPRSVGSSVPMTEANVGRLERRLRQAGDVQSLRDSDVASVLSVSAYTTSSIAPSAARYDGRHRRAASGCSGPLSARGSARCASTRATTPRSARGLASPGGPASARGGVPGTPSLAAVAAASVGGDFGGGAFEATPKAAGSSLEWAVLDKLSAHMHKQDAVRQRQREAEIQKRLREDLRRQVMDAQLKEKREKEEDLRFHQEQADATARWAEEEGAKRALAREKRLIENEERAKQVVEVQARRDVETRRLKDEAEQLQKRVHVDLEKERRRVEDEYHSRRDQQKQALIASSEAAEFRQRQVKEKEDAENASLERYEQLREARELSARRQKELQSGRRQMIENKGAELAGQHMAKEKEAEAKAAQEQRAKSDALARHEEQTKRRLDEQKLETQAFLLSQMQEKQKKKQVERQRSLALRREQEVDAEDFVHLEQQRGQEKRLRNVEHKAELERQIATKMASSGAPKGSEVMSEVELRINRTLLERVNKALSEIGERDGASSCGRSVRA
eukprot:TRINITY_DN54592_c0_g1_i1.p2 TRINITY_DN54592_c0_g1~~TRINITY_DN54592_c0_g1_i1.p2  ORF type:complete len:554 (+),score=151.05 TRINITY_DN54592_c0_g1_i1:103-1662(+)